MTRSRRRRPARWFCAVCGEAHHSELSTEAKLDPGGRVSQLCSIECEQALRVNIGLLTHEDGAVLMFTSRTRLSHTHPHVFGIQIGALRHWAKGNS